uniref:Uncharacterized protein n=1 Tax=Tanacetum cinerariifolium TaxID=118510 RepID=A0A699GFH5_TANCI|nr:hypothetical protein [Tanacetum cinerariifolium]
MLALDQADFFQRQQGARDARGSESLALGQVHAAQASARRAVQVMEQHEVAEADAVVAAQHLVEPAHQCRLRARQAQREFQAGQNAGLRGQCHAHGNNRDLSDRNAAHLYGAIPDLAPGRHRLLCAAGGGANHYRRDPGAGHPGPGLSRVLQLCIQPASGAVAQWHCLVGGDDLRDAGRDRARPEKSVGAPAREHHHGRPGAGHAAGVRLRGGGRHAGLCRLDRAEGAVVAVRAGRGHGVRGHGAADPDPADGKVGNPAREHRPAHLALRQPGRYRHLGRAGRDHAGLEPRDAPAGLFRGVHRCHQTVPSADGQAAGARSLVRLADLAGGSVVHGRLGGAALHGGRVPGRRRDGRPLVRAEAARFHAPDRADDDHARVFPQRRAAHQLGRGRLGRLHCRRRAAGGVAVGQADRHARGRQDPQMGTGRGVDHRLAVADQGADHDHLLQHPARQGRDHQRNLYRAAADGHCQHHADGAGGPALPDRLSIDPRSPHHVAAVFEHEVGITFNGKERMDVDEYCISEGWIKVPAGKAVDRRGGFFSLPIKPRALRWFSRWRTGAAAVLRAACRASAASFQALVQDAHQHQRTERRGHHQIADHFEVLEAAVGALAHDMAGHHRRHASGQLLQRRADRIERAALVGRRHRLRHGLERNHAREYAHEHDGVERDQGHQRNPAQVRVHDHRHHRQHGAEDEHRELAPPVGHASDQRTGKNGADARHQVHGRQVRHVDAEVVDDVSAAERHQHEAARGQQGRGGKRQQVPRDLDRVIQVHPRTAILRLAQVGVHRFHLPRHDQAAHQAKPGQRQERDVPVPVVGQINADRDAQHLAGGKRGLDQAHHAPAHRGREQVGGNGQHDGTDHAAEQAGHHARAHQRFKTLRQAAPHGAQDKTRIKEQQQFLAVVAVGKARREQTRNTGAERIRRHHQPELLRPDIERRHDHGAQRRHDHKVEYHGKLQESQHGHHDFLVAGEGSGCFGSRCFLHGAVLVGCAGFIGREIHLAPLVVEQDVELAQDAVADVAGQGSATRAIEQSARVGGQFQRGVGDAHVADLEQLALRGQHPALAADALRGLHDVAGAVFLHQAVTLHEGLVHGQRVVAAGVDGEHAGQAVQHCRHLRGLVVKGEGDRRCGAAIDELARVVERDLARRVVDAGGRERQPFVADGAVDGQIVQRGAGEKRLLVQRQSRQPDLLDGGEHAALALLAHAREHRHALHRQLQTPVQLVADDVARARVEDEAERSLAVERERHADMRLARLERHRHRWPVGRKTFDDGRLRQRKIELGGRAVEHDAGDAQHVFVAFVAGVARAFLERQCHCADAAKIAVVDGKGLVADDFLAALDAARRGVDPEVERAAALRRHPHHGVMHALVLARLPERQRPRLAAREPPAIRLAAQVLFRVAGVGVELFHAAHALLPEIAPVRARHLARHGRRRNALRVTAADEIDVAAARFIVIEVAAHELGLLGGNGAPGVASHGRARLRQQRLGAGRRAGHRSGRRTCTTSRMVAEILAGAGANTRANENGHRDLRWPFSHAAATGAVGAARVAALVAAAGRAFLARSARFAEAALAWLGAATVVAWFPAAWTRGRAWSHARFLRLVALDHIHRNQLLGEAFDAFDVHAFGVVDQRDGLAIATGTAGTADAVHIVLGELRQVVVEHVGNRRHVDTAGGNVGGDQDFHLAAAQAVQRAVTGALVHVAMQCGSRETGDVQTVGDGVGVTLGGGKHHGLVERFVAQQVVQQAVLVRQVVHEVHGLGDVFVFVGSADDLDDLRILGDAAGHIAHHAVQGGREQHGLARRWRRFDDFFDVVDETHVQHAVGFVQHQDFQLREVDLARFHVVDQAARGGDQDLRILGQQLHLLRVRHAAQDRDSLDAAQVDAVFVGIAGHLQGQFAGRREHQHLRLGSLEAWTFATGAGGLHFLVGRLAGSCRLDCEQTVQRRQHEGCSLAGTGLRGYQQVLACDGRRNSLLLHRGWRGVAGVGQGFDDGRVET